MKSHKIIFILFVFDVYFRINHENAFAILIIQRIMIGTTQTKQNNEYFVDNKENNFFSFLRRENNTIYVNNYFFFQKKEFCFLSKFFFEISVF